MYDDTDATPSFIQQAADAKPTFLGWLFVACTAIIMVMLTVKLGMVLFT